jgi:hypothetical protein
MNYIERTDGEQLYKHVLINIFMSSSDVIPQMHNGIAM